MLGLGSTVVRSNAFETDPNYLGSYISDFSSGIDNFQKLSVHSNSTKLTLSSATGPDGTAGWLKGVFSQDQPDVVTIYKNDISTPWTRSNTDYAVVSYKIHLVGDWEGEDDVGTNTWVGRRTGSGWAGGDYFTTAIAQDTNVEVSDVGSAMGINNYNTFQIQWNDSSDNPQNEAEFYVKDIKVDFYKV